MINKWFLYYVLDGDSVVWVGISKNPNKRFLNHLYPENKETNKKKLEWARNLKKRNIKPTLKVISEFESKKDALKSEKSHTENLRKTNSLLNIYDGCVPDLENRIKSSIYNTGKKHSEETKKKISSYFKQPEFVANAINNGRKASKKIIDNNGKIYDSISQAARDTGCHRVNIGDNLSGKFNQIKGYTFKYV